MENKLTERCCLGKFLGEDCDKTTYCRNISRLDISNFDEKIIDLMQERSLYNFKTVDTICFYHEKVYCTCYGALQLYCFDPYQVHKKKISKGLHIPESTVAVTLEMKPGQKLCVNCMKSYQEKLNFAESSDDDKNDGHTEEDPDYIDHGINRTVLIDSATLLGLSPIKAVGKQDRAGYGKQKVKKFKKSLVGLVASVSETDKNELLHHDSPECSKYSDIDRLTELLKDKLKMNSTQEKVKILTLAPESWSISKTCNEFDLSEYLVKKARKLKNSKGILAEAEKKERKCIK